MKGRDSFFFHPAKLYNVVLLLKRLETPVLKNGMWACAEQLKGENHLLKFWRNVFYAYIALLK